MKLTLNDSLKTIITAINTKINKKGDWNETNGYYYYITINDLKLEYVGKNCSSIAQNDFNKLIRKGAIRVFNSYVSEQEKACFDGIKADQLNPKMHGHKVYSVLCSNTDLSGVYVWDYNKQCAVLECDLSEKPIY